MRLITNQNRIENYFKCLLQFLEDIIVIRQTINILYIHLQILADNIVIRYNILYIVTKLVDIIVIRHNSS